MITRKMTFSSGILMVLFIMTFFLLWGWASYNLYQIKSSKTTTFFRASEEYVISSPAVATRYAKVLPVNAQKIAAEAIKVENVAAKPVEIPANVSIVPATTITPPKATLRTLPNYPENALNDGLEGTALLRVFIKQDGSIGEVMLSRSSGWKMLDEAAKASIFEWKFEAAKNGVTAISSYLEVPIKFVIK